MKCVWGEEVQNMVKIAKAYLDSCAKEQNILKAREFAKDTKNAVERILENFEYRLKKANSKNPNNIKEYPIN